MTLISSFSCHCSIAVQLFSIPLVQSSNFQVLNCIKGRDSPRVINKITANCLFNQPKDMYSASSRLASPCHHPHQVPAIQSLHSDSSKIQSDPSTVQSES